ncbi:MAG: hypothetical protein JXJ17_16880 [Anaerolineae bacterium]|nr:hypothetical protein [Anaerolineae bacterium]
MEIVKEFDTSRGSKKVAIVQTGYGLKIMVDVSGDGEVVDWPILNEDGSITYQDPNNIPKYVDKLVEKAQQELQIMKETNKDTFTFTSWLFSQNDRSDPVGELARGAERDRTWPRKGNTYHVFEEYLAVDDASRGLLDALALAWAEFEQHVQEEPVSEEDLFEQLS